MFECGCLSKGGCAIFLEGVAGACRICGSAREVAVDRNRMLLIGSVIVAILFLAYIMLGPGGISVPR